MSKKIEKLKEVNLALNKRLIYLETYMFIQNIVDFTKNKTKNNNNEIN